MNVPYLKQKIWYAFEGLPSELVDGEERLPWSKCLVFTNNIMYILKMNQLTEEFKITITKLKAEISHGVTYNEYIEFLNGYFVKQFSYLTSIDNNNMRTERSGSSASLDPLSNSAEIDRPSMTQRKPRGNTIDQMSTSPISGISNTQIKAPDDPKAPSPINTFDDYCWTLYRTTNIPNLANGSNLDKSFMKLWNLFIVYSLRNSEQQVEIPIFMDILEAKHLCNTIRELLGARRIIDNLEIEENIVKIDFLQFYSMVLELVQATNLNEKVIEMTIDNLCEEALDGITIKGSIKVNKYIRYCVLKTSILYIYNNKVGPINFRSCFVIDKNTEINTGTNKIQIISPQSSGTITIEITDNHQFNKWRSALCEAVEMASQHVDNASLHESYLRHKVRENRRLLLSQTRKEMEERLEQERLARCKVTEDMELKLSEADRELNSFREKMLKEEKEKENLRQQTEEIRLEKEKRIKEILENQQLLYQQQLEQLKAIEMEKNSLNELLEVTKEQKSLEENKRFELEEKHLDAQNQLVEAEEKIKSLQSLRTELEKALDEEKQAKEDEEKVRDAALALLDEELKSKEKLQMMLDAKSDAMSLEIQKRNEFAAELEAERTRINEIANEKEKLAQQLEESQERMKNSNLKVRRLDNKVTMISETIFGSSEARAPVSHRGPGFLNNINLRSTSKVKRERVNLNEPITPPSIDEGTDMTPSLNETA